MTNAQGCSHREGLLMDHSTRNAKTVTALIISMSVGAALLLGLEPKNDNPPSTMLIARDAAAVDSLLVEFVPQESADSLAAYHCVILPDKEGSCVWRPDGGSQIRLAILGPQDQPLGQEQAHNLLRVVGTLHRSYGLDFSNIRLAVNTAPGGQASTERGPRDLRDLLVRKGFIK
jgi:hypothetical protein